MQTFSHLSTCEILHTSHNWSMTVSATASGVFLHAFYTNYMNYCISRFWCIINVIALKLIVVGFSFFFLFFRLFCVKTVNLK